MRKRSVVRAGASPELHLVCNTSFTTLKQRPSLPRLSRDNTNDGPKKKETNKYVTLLCLYIATPFFRSFFPCDKSNNAQMNRVSPSSSARQSPHTPAQANFRSLQSYSPSLNAEWESVDLVALEAQGKPIFQAQKLKLIAIYSAQSRGSKI